MSILFPLTSCSRRLLKFPKQIGRRPQLPCRCTSTLAKSDFKSFFYRNGYWPIAPNHSNRLDRPSSRCITHAMTVEQTNIISATRGLEGHRKIELLTPRRLLGLYMQLSKSRLTVLNVLTAMSGVALYPLPTTVPILISTALGTALCAASANTLNQLQEVPYDAQMARTRMRPLVRRAITPLHAAGFAALTGIAGPAILWTMVNPTTAILGAANIALYAGLYTWL
jgi:protoheme IX farnesyltransferase